MRWLFVVGYLDEHHTIFRLSFTFLADSISFSVQMLKILTLRVEWIDSRPLKVKYHRRLSLSIDLYWIPLYRQPFKLAQKS